MFSRLEGGQMRQILAGILGAVLTACISAPAPNSSTLPEAASISEKVYFIGQDLDAIRGYMGSECCVRPDGTTAYLSLYGLRNGPQFGGLGYDLDGRMIDPEARWGAGPVSAQKSATEFGLADLQIGLFISESEARAGLEQIANGAFDQNILRLSQFTKSVEGQVYLRIGYEFDGAWNTGLEKTDYYIAAYRHIVDVMRLDGASNVEFVWHATASIIDDLIEQGHEDIEAWYPGDDYVDWLAVSWFLPPETRPSDPPGFELRRPVDLADEVVAFARRLRKPVMIAESAPQGFDLEALNRANISPILDGPSGENIEPLEAEQIWQAWYAPMFKWMADNGDIVRGFSYINVDWDSQPIWGPPYESGYWGDTRLETQPALARRFNEAVTGWRQTE